jgi:hypothetical protein
MSDAEPAQPTAFRGTEGHASLDFVFEMVREQTYALQARADALNAQIATVLTMFGLLLTLLSIWKPPSTHLDTSSLSGLAIGVVPFIAVAVFFMGLGTSIVTFSIRGFLAIDPIVLYQKYIDLPDDQSKAAALQSLLSAYDANRMATRIKARWAGITVRMLALEGLLIGILVTRALIS